MMARRAEELGYEMIAVPEHFVVPNTHVELSSPHYFHSTVAQSFLTGATQRIAVNSCVTLLPLQNPIVLAKALSTAGWMSGGRIMVSFGVGWDAEEFKVLGALGLGAGTAHGTPTGRTNGAGGPRAETRNSCPACDYNPLVAVGGDRLTTRVVGGGRCRL
jgi:alkanesulfonate monooxygenase SsuD/methylene tetrahydromethanopterin reductase-like flavin-dependent oxidoreductase (luciferase family)